MTDSCSEEGAGVKKTSYQKYKENHQCTICGKQDELTLSGRAYCRQCAERKREKRRTRKQEGRCTACGRQDDRTLAGKATCERCSEEISACKIQRERRYLESGQCIICGRSDEPLQENGMCSICTEKQSNRKRSLAETRKREHRCTSCGQQDSRTLDGLTICQACCDRMSQQRDRRHEHSKAAGLCVKCGAKDARTMIGKAYCWECAEKGRTAYMSWSIENKEHVSAYKKKLYNGRKELGLCCLCGGKLPNGYRYASCPKCLGRKALYRAGKPAVLHDEPDPNMCSACHKRPKLAGYKVCEECRIRCIKNLSHVDRKNHPWRNSNRAIFRKKDDSGHIDIPQTQGET